jgi:molybdopterin-guanine dinucleotide biosynthesis protein A
MWRMPERPDSRGRVVAAIIAGGRGTRMGTVDKSALLVGGRSILDWQLQALRGRFARVLLVLGEQPAPPVPADLAVLRDRAAPGSGPLAGLDAALAALAPDETAAVCIAADLPLVTPPPLELLRDTAPDADALVPLVAGQPEPLFARYHRRCAPAIAAALRDRRLKTMALLAAVRVHFLPEATLRRADATLACLLNVNTPEDLARAEQLLASA